MYCIVLVEKGATEPGGVHRYAANVTRLLLLGGEGVDVALFTHWNRKLLEFLPRDVIADPRLRIYTYHPIIDNAIFALLWHVIVLPLRTLKLRPSVVHVTNGRAAFCAPGALKVTTVHDVAELDIVDKFDTLRMQYRRFIQYPYLRAQARLTTVSASAAEDLQQHLGIDPKDLTVVPNVVFPVPTPQAHHNFSVAYVGRLDHPSKNLLTLIAAFERASSRNESLRLDLIGSDSWNAAVVHRAIETSPVSDRIHVHGWVGENLLGELLSKALVLCLPSRHEGFGIPVIEALSYGVPVLAAEAGSLPEVLRTRAGLIPPDDIDAWAEAILEVLEPQARLTLLTEQLRTRDFQHELRRARQALVDVYGVRE